MFGLKIITKREYRNLLDCFYKCRDLLAEVNALKHENKALMKELTKLDCVPKVDRPDAQASAEDDAKKLLVEGHMVIFSASRPCDGCPEETETCKKLYNGKNGTICVEPEKN